MTNVTCRLTAKNRDQFRNSTLGNRVWATFTFLYVLPAVGLRVTGPKGNWPEVLMTQQAAARIQKLVQ